MTTPPPVPPERATPDSTGPPTPSTTAGETALVIQRHFSSARLSTYVRASGGDLEAAVDLYRWNAAAAGALWEVLGHTEVVLRNALHGALAARHTRLGRPGQWFDDPAGELDARALKDIATARTRLRRAGAPLLAGKVVAELNFGFWRFLLARRYTATLWPAMRPAFAHLSTSDRRVLEAPVTRLHTLRNRVAHHEPLLTEPLAERYTDLLTVIGFVDPRLRTWVEEHNSVPAVLAQRP